MGTQDLVFLWLVLLATVDCNWEPLTQLQVRTHGKRTRASLVQSAPSLPHRRPSQSVLVPHTPLTPCDDASKCRARSRPKSTSTKAQWTASRKLLQKRDWLQVCTKDLQQTFCAVWVVPWFWCSMTGRRLISLFEEMV